MGRTGRWRRELALIAVLLGLLCLHAIDPAPATHDPAGGSTRLAAATAAPKAAQATSSPTRPAGEPTTGAVATPDPTTGPDGGHDCLAVLTGLSVLALAAAAPATPTRRPRTAAQPRVIAVRPRPPPPSAVRLAQLSVLRN